MQRSMINVISCPDRGPFARRKSQFTIPCIPPFAEIILTIPPIVKVKTMMVTWSESKIEPTIYVSTTRNSPLPNAVPGSCPVNSAIRKVPDSTPRNSADITSFNTRAITIAIRGGNTDSHSGIGPPIGPQK